VIRDDTAGRDRESRPCSEGMTCTRRVFLIKSVVAEVGGQKPAGRGRSDSFSVDLMFATEIIKFTMVKLMSFSKPS
jgi:hypothetical protein